MAKRKRELTHAKVERYIKEGRGQGTGKDYLPWLRIQVLAEYKASDSRWR